MLNLINDLLDVTRIESGHLDLRVMPGDWGAFVRRNVDLNGELAARRGVAIEVDAAGAESLTIPFDPNRMEQVLNNLVGNAVKFSPAGSRIVVRIVREGRFVRSSVVDNGPGIPARNCRRSSSRSTAAAPRCPRGAQHGPGAGDRPADRRGARGEIGVDSKEGAAPPSGLLFPYQPLSDSRPLRVLTLRTSIVLTPFRDGDLPYAPPCAPCVIRGLRIQSTKPIF